MRTNCLLYRLSTLLVLPALLFGPMPGGSATGLTLQSIDAQTADSGLYRTYANWDSPVMQRGQHVRAMISRLREDKR